jgi:hypothetical protein
MRFIGSRFRLKLHGICFYKPLADELRRQQALFDGVCQPQEQQGTVTNAVMSDARR